jgi:hypothetical protein
MAKILKFDEELLLGNWINGLGLVVKMDIGLKNLYGG